MNRSCRTVSKTELQFAAVCLLSAIVLSGWLQAAPRSEFRRTTVAAIVKAGRGADGSRVELHGRIVSGFETSVFEDSSACGEQTMRCAIWVDLSNCKVAKGSWSATRCDDLVEHFSEKQHRGDGVPDLFVLDNAVLRGVVSAVRRDIAYDKSVDKSFRIGFGHLGAYPAKIEVNLLSLGPVR